MFGPLSSFNFVQSYKHFSLKLFQEYLIKSNKLSLKHWKKFPFRITIRSNRKKCHENCPCEYNIKSSHIEIIRFQNLLEDKNKTKKTRIMNNVGIWNLIYFNLKCRKCCWSVFVCWVCCKMFSFCLLI